LYGGVTTLVLVLASGWEDAAAASFFAILVFLLSALAISRALKLVEKDTIASFRRVLALQLAGALLWLALVAVGWIYALAARSPGSLTNAYLYGAFVSIGLEYLIINGAFTKSATLSLGLASIQPGATLFIVKFTELKAQVDGVALACGVLSLVVIAAFPTFLKQKKTSRGHDALSLFRAFMKTWAAGRPDDLECMIASHSEEAEAHTKVLRFRTRSGDTFLVLPGIHPGPFYPIGSYDLPGVISREFKDIGAVMTLHRPGGHERNLATRADTADYAKGVKELAKSIEVDEKDALLRGPSRAEVGKATASTLVFSNDALLTISFAPHGSDDLDTKVEMAMSELGSEVGLNVSVVDAHNSISDSIESPETSDPGWRALLKATGEEEAKGFDAAYAHSGEVGFKGNGDLTENGIGLLMVRSGTRKSVLILADANNSISPLRAGVESALDVAGYKLVEFCTSDSHNLAARGLTAQRGYEALGEATPVGAIAEVAVKLAKLADSRLAPAEYGSASEGRKVRVFGANALNEFAAITQASSVFARRYLEVALVVLGALLVASLIL
jgi:putative membrane protein